MEHTAIPEPPGFAKLSKAEQVRYLQALWDRIAEKPAELAVPESHLELRRNGSPSTGVIRHAPDRPTKWLTV